MHVALAKFYTSASLMGNLCIAHVFSHAIATPTNKSETRLAKQASMANRRDKITQRRIQAKTAPGILSSRALYLSSMILIVITAVGILWMPETVDKVMSLMISSKAIGAQWL